MNPVRIFTVTLLTFSTLALFSLSSAETLLVVDQQETDISQAYSSAADYAVKFVPTKPGLKKISIYLEPVETPPNRPVYISEDVNGAPALWGKHGFLGYKWVISAKAQKGWYDIPFELTLTPGKTYWIVFPTQGHYKWYGPPKGSTNTGRYRSGNKWYCGGLNFAFKTWVEPTSDTPRPIPKGHEKEKSISVKPGKKAIPTLTIINPGFEDEIPFKGWSRPGWPFYKTDIASGGHTGKRCAFLEDITGYTWGYFQQKVPLEEGEYGEYKIKAWVRLEGGYAFLWVQGLDANSKVCFGKRVYQISHRLNPMVPDFVPAKYMKGDEKWHPLQIKVKVEPPVKYLNIRLGSYFTPGRIYFDDVSIKGGIK